MKRIARAIISGSGASVLSALMVALRARSDSKTACQGINGPSHWIWGERAFLGRKPSWRYTAVGLLIHHVSSIFWAFFFECLIERRQALTLHDGTTPANEHSADLPCVTGVSPVGICSAALAIAVLANVVDYKVTPCRFRPGFERRLSRPSLALVYLAFGVGLAATAKWRDRR